MSYLTSTRSGYILGMDPYHTRIPMSLSNYYHYGNILSLNVDGELQIVPQTPLKELSNELFHKNKFSNLKLSEV